jgi:hypothetical protein
MVGGCRAFNAFNAFNAICDNEHDFDIVCPHELPHHEREFLIQHLIYSLYIKELTKKGDAILESIWNRKRSRKRLLHDKVLRYVVRTIRRFGKYETLRSCLEGLLFDQVQYLDRPYDIPFNLRGIEDDISLTQVYFNTAAWADRKCGHEQLGFEMEHGEHVTHSDIAQLLLFFSMLEYMIKEIRAYLVEHTRGTWTAKPTTCKWRYRAMKYIHTIQRGQRRVTTALIEHLESMDSIRSTTESVKIIE